MRAAAYCRVSTAAQGEADRYGLPAQREAVEAYCAANGLTIEAEYEDIASGADINRPALLRMLSDLSPNGQSHPKAEPMDAPRFEVVVVAKWDRLARDTTLDGYLRFSIEQAGCRIVSATETNGIDPISKMTQAILAAVAEFERARIAERMHGGRKIKKARGGYSGGKAPFGWKPRGDGTLEPVPEQQADLRWILEWRHEEGLSLSQIARRLNAANVPTARGGKAWRESSVRSVLRSAKVAA